MIVAGRAAGDFAGAGDFHFLGDGLLGLLLHMGTELGDDLGWNDDGGESSRCTLDLFFEFVRDREAFEKGIQVFLGFVGHRFLAAVEYDLDSHFVSFRHEFLSLRFLEEEIVGVGAETDADAFDVDFLLFRFGLLLFLGLLVYELAVVGELADRGLGERGDLDEVGFALLCELESRCKRHGAEILTALIDHDDFRCQNLLVDTERILRSHLRLRSIVPSSSHESMIA